jgi:hypothetical protein
MKAIKFMLAFAFITVLIQPKASAQNKQFKALLVTTTNGWHHESLHYGVVALKELAIRNYFDITLFENPNGFTDKYLEQFQVIIFLSTTGNILDSAQQKVMERFIKSGKGYVGIHSASDTEYDWEWYTKLVGRMFHIHPVIQTAKLNILDATFPGLQGFANNKLWTDEWYEFGPEKIAGLNYVLAVDESTYDAKAEKELAWVNCTRFPGIITMMVAVLFIQHLATCLLFTVMQHFLIICMQVFYGLLQVKNNDCGTAVYYISTESYTTTFFHSEEHSSTNFK